MSNDLPPPDPNRLARFFAILLLLVMTPVLLFAGFCGLMTAASLFAPLGIGIFAALAYITYKGVRTFWYLHEAPDGTGWVMLLILIPILTGAVVWVAGSFRP